MSCSRFASSLAFRNEFARPLDNGTSIVWKNEVASLLHLGPTKRMSVRNDRHEHPVVHPEKTNVHLALAETNPVRNVLRDLILRLRRQEGPRLAMVAIELLDVPGKDQS
jgi:hypothetical protein